MNDNERSEVFSKDRQNFQMIPDWVIAAVSANGVKMYLILRRYSDNVNHVAWPSRATLAHDMGFKSVRSIDPVIAELEEVGAVEVIRTKVDGRNAVNKYAMAWFEPDSRLVSKYEKTTTCGGGSAENCTTNEDAGVVQKTARGSAENCTRVVQKTAPELRTKNYNQRTTKYTAAASLPAAEPEQPMLGEVSIIERHDVDIPKQNTATLIGEWIDHCAEKPPARVIGQMSREIKNLLVEGIGYERVRSALAELHRKGANPATLASFVYSQSAVIEMPQAIPNRATIRESTESTTTQRMRQTAVLVEQLRAQGR